MVIIVIMLTDSVCMEVREVTVLVITVAIAVFVLSFTISVRCNLRAPLPPPKQIHLTVPAQIPPTQPAEITPEQAPAQATEYKVECDATALYKNVTTGKHHMLSCTQKGKLADCHFQGHLCTKCFTIKPRLAIR